jgi:hypothetical protein
MQKHYSLEITNHKVAFAVYVNDILLSTNRFHQQGTNEFPINHYVYNGENTLRLNISINPKWFEEMKEQKAQVRIIESRGISGSFEESDIVVLKWQWDETVQFPVNLTTQFNLEIPYGSWLWLDADMLTEDDLNFQTLHGYLHSLHDLLNNKDYGRLEPFLTYKSTDLANAFYIPFPERLADQKRFFENELFSTSGWGMEPMDVSNLMFDFHANNRLVRIVKTNGKSPLTSKPIGDIVFELDLFLCHKNNQWILCR